MKEQGKIFANGRLVGKGGLVFYMANSIEEVTSYVEDPYILNRARDYDICEWEMENITGMTEKY